MPPLATSLSNVLFLTPASSTRNTLQPSGNFTGLVLKNNASQVLPLVTYKTSGGVNLAEWGPAGLNMIPGATDAYAIQIDRSVNPATTSNSLYGIFLKDTAANDGKLLAIDHYGTGDATNAEAYAIDIANRPGANSPLVIHDYSAVSPTVQVDNTAGGSAFLRLKSTENPILSPGTWGSSPYMEFLGVVPIGTTTTVTTGAASATQLVGNTAGMVANKVLYFVTAGVERIIQSVTDGTHVVLTATVTTTSGETVRIGYSTKVTTGAASATQTVDDTTGMLAGNLLGFATAGVTRTIQSVTNGTTVVLTSSVTTVTGEYVRIGGLTSSWGNLDKDLIFHCTNAGKSWTFTADSTYATPALKVSQSNNADGLLIGHSGTGSKYGLEIVETGGSQACLINSNVSAAAGLYPLEVQGWNYGPKFSMSQNATNAALTLVKSGNSTGVVMYIKNAGTGVSLSIEDNSGNVKASVTQAGLGTFAGLSITDATDIALATTTGTKIGTATSQKLGFWNVTPIIQPAGALQAAPAAYVTGAFGLDSNAHMQALYDLVVAIRTALVNSGIMKGAA